MSVTIYIEGGGDGASLDARFREGWATFFERAGLQGRMPRIVRGRGRKSTWDLFTNARANRHPDRLPLLLLDSEDVPTAGHSAWQHLKVREQDGWNKPVSAGDHDAFLMVCAMETWFIADRPGLRAFFGQHFRDTAIPKWPDLEAVPRLAIFEALKNATAACPNRGYSKGRVSFKLLAAIDPFTVEKNCQAARLLLNRLRSLK